MNRISQLSPLSLQIQWAVLPVRHQWNDHQLMSNIFFSLILVVILPLFSVLCIILDTSINLRRELRILEPSSSQQIYKDHPSVSLFQLILIYFFSQLLEHLQRFWIPMDLMCLVSSCSFNNYTLLRGFTILNVGSMSFVSLTITNELTLVLDMKQMASNHLYINYKNNFS